MKSVVFIVVLVSFATAPYAQNNPRPTASRFWLSKASTFQIKPADVLVYEVKKESDVYNFIAIVKKYGESITFDYSMPDKDINGSTTISAASLKSGVTYNNIFTNNADAANDKGSLWLSSENFRALASNSKQTKLDFGDGLQLFKREATLTQKIQYKGDERIVTFFKVVAANGGDINQFWVLNDIANPLIIKMDGANTINLKEVR